MGKSEVTEDVLWATGSIDLVLFDARSGTYTGPALDRVPLYLVNGAGYGASLLEAKLIAHAELFASFKTIGRVHSLIPHSIVLQIPQMQSSWPPSYAHGHRALACSLPTM